MIHSSYVKFFHDEMEIDSFKAGVLEKDIYDEEGRCLSKEVTFDAGLAPYSFGFTRVEFWHYNNLEKYFEYSETKYAQRMEPIKGRFKKPKNALHFMASLLE
jgi:hypothetical protein